MKTKWLQCVVEQVSKILFSYEYKCSSRQNQEYFTRKNGKIGFINVIGIVLNFMGKSMQTEMKNYFKHVFKTTERVSKQAFAQARHKLTVAAFSILFDASAASSAKLPGAETFKGFRVPAIDGTTLALEDTYHLRAYYGTVGGDHGYAGARASTMVDVLNKGVILDARIDKLSVGENKLAMRHIGRLKELDVELPLLVFDRNYASAEMFQTLSDTAFLFRLKRRFNAKIDKLPLGDVAMKTNVKGATFCLRVLKFKLDTGEVETLVTNLQKETISSDDLKELYRLRWRIETSYSTIKNALQIENFSGTSQLVVEQDFYASMFLKNIVAFAKHDSDIIVEQHQNPGNLHSQQTNESQLIGLLKDDLVIALLGKRPRVQARLINAIIMEAARNRIPIREGRTFPRKRKSNKRFYMSGKPVL